MPLRHHAHSTPPELIEQILAIKAAAPETTAAQIAAAIGSSEDTARRLLNRFERVSDHVRAVKRDELSFAWENLGLKSLARADELLDQEPQAVAAVSAKSSIAAEIRNYAVAAGISTEKVLLLAGQPTQIAYVAHAHRVILPDLVERIAAARAIQGHEAAQSSQVPDLTQDAGRVNGD